MEIFYSVFGMIYAIVAGFVILVLLEDYNAIKNHIGEEINALQDLRDFLVYVDNNDEAVAEIKRAIKTYVASVIDKEWPAMVAAHKTDLDTSPELYAVMKSINQINPTNQSDIVALEKLIDTVGEITDHRTNRLDASQEKLPLLLKPFLITMSALVVFVFMLLAIPDPVARFLLNGANIVAVGFIYIIIIDLSNPFKGGWSIDDEDFRDLLTKL